jgi:hypothetical protein
MARISVTAPLSNHCTTSHKYVGAEVQITIKLHAFENKVLEKIIFQHKMRVIKGHCWILKRQESRFTDSKLILEKL